MEATHILAEYIVVDGCLMRILIKFCPQANYPQDSKTPLTDPQTQ